MGLVVPAGSRKYLHKWTGEYLDQPKGGDEGEDEVVVGVKMNR